MKISITHQQFANRLRNQRALEHPEEFLGPNWKDVLNFWIFLDTLTEEQWGIIGERYWDLDEDVRHASSTVAHDAALEATNRATVAHDAALEATNRAAVNSVCFVTISCYAISATNELIGSHILTAQGKSLVFLPLCLTV